MSRSKLKTGETAPEFVREYLEECRARGLRPNTLRLYGFFIRTFDIIGAKSYQPSKMTSKKLAQWAIDVRKKYARPETHIGVVARFLKWAYWRHKRPEWIEMPYMIPEHLRILRQRRRTNQEPRELPILTPGQIQILIQACRQTHNPERNEALITLLWDTGFRISETLSMKTKNIYQSTDHKGVQRWYAYCPISKTKPRKVVLHDSMDSMQQYIKQKDPETPLWTNKKGNPLDYSTWQTTLNRIITQAKKNDLTIRFPKGCKSHLFRHSRATYLADHGWNEAMLMKRFGWTQSRMATHYVEQSRIDTGAALDKMPNPLLQTIPTARPNTNTMLTPLIRPEPIITTNPGRYCPRCGSQIIPQYLSETITLPTDFTEISNKLRQRTV